MDSVRPTLDEFLELPTQDVRNILYPKHLSISLLLNGTRRLYIAQHFDAPPTDNSYLPDYLKFILETLGHLLEMLAAHGLYRIFMPTYSQTQLKYRDRNAHQVLLKGIGQLKEHPFMLDVYRQAGYAVHFYGDMSYLPQDLISCLRQPPRLFAEEPQHHVYYGVDGAAHVQTYIFQLAHEFSLTQGHPPSWEDMVELYYGDRSLRPLDILIGFGRIYDGGGIPPLLNGYDRIYVTAVSPAVLTQAALRKILYDFAFNRHDFGRDYADIHPNEVQRLKHFYEANKDTVIGLTQKYEDLCYPMPGLAWPKEMG